MKQQFFVGDNVRLADKIDKHSHVFWIDMIEKSKGIIGVVQAIVTYESSDIGYSVKFDNRYYNCDAKWLTIVERAWQKNTGMQPVDDSVFVEYKQRDMVWQAECAGDLIWTNTIVNPITEWRIADSIPSDEEQPEGVPHMKAWCETCQGTGEIDETLGGESFSSRHTPCPDCDGKGWWEMVMPEVGSVDVPYISAEQDKKHSHYFKKCGYDYVDIYRVLKMFDVTDPCISHACKKLLVSGGRGFKDIEHDIQDVIDTLVRWQEMRKEDDELCK